MNSRFAALALSAFALIGPALAQETSAIGPENVLNAFYSDPTNFPYGGPTSGLTAGKDGNFYFIAEDLASGNQNGQQAILQMTTAGAAKLMYQFTDGSSMDGGLTQAADGNLYGIAFLPGSSAYLFAFNIAKSTIVAKYSLGSIAGGDGVVPDLEGNLYGVTYKGGAFGDGQIFKFHLPTGNPPAAGVLSTLYSFAAGTDGGNPFYTPLIAANGLLYGSTNNACDGANRGGIFSFNLTTSALTPIVCLDSANLYGILNGFTQTGTGLMYAATASGGAYSDGEIFSFDGTSVVDVKDFNTDRSGGNISIDEVYQDSIFLADDSTNLIVPGAGGGYSGSGVISEFNENGQETDLYSFDGTSQGTGTLANASGVYPRSLYLGQDGNLYGLTAIGGPYDAGVFFDFAAATDNLPPTISLTPSVTTAYSGSTYTLTWAVHNAWSKTAQACFAFSSDSEFNGAIATSGSIEIIAGNAGTHNYSINCGGVETAIAAVKVVTGGITVSSGGVTLTSTSYNFGAVPENGSSSVTWQLTNNGGVNFPVSVTKTGSTSSYFSTSNTCGASLAPTASCSITFSYSAPATSQNDQATFTIAKQGFVFTPGNAFTFTAHTVAPGVITLSSTAHDFGSVSSGFSQSYTFQVYNGTGGTPSFALSGSTIDGAISEGSYTTTCPATLAVNQTCSVTFTFNAGGSTGAYEYDITVISNAPVKPANVVKMTADITSGS